MHVQWCSVFACVILRQVGSASEHTRVLIPVARYYKGGRPRVPLVLISLHVATKAGDPSSPLRQGALGQHIQGLTILSAGGKEDAKSEETERVVAENTKLLADNRRLFADNRRLFVENRGLITGKEAAEQEA
eukprot:3697530-Rhodomonas_salina.1